MQRLELGRRFAIRRRAVVPILHRDVARARQPREPLVVQPRIFLERGQSRDLRSLRSEQFLLFPVDLPARLDLHLRRPRRPLGLAPPCARTVQKGAPILANQPHVHGRRAHLSLCVAQVRQRPIDLELERDRIELRQRGSRSDDHVVVRIQRNNLAADIRGNGCDVPFDIRVGRPHLDHVPDPPAEHDARRAQQESQGSGQPECAAPARRSRRPPSRLTPKRSQPGLGRSQRFARSSGHQNALPSRTPEPESSIQLDRPVLETCLKGRTPVTRHGRDELETRPEPCNGTDCPSNNQLSGGFPKRTDSRISPLLPFQPDSGSAYPL